MNFNKMENILDKLPENIKQMVLINAFHDGQDIRVKKLHTVNNPYYLKEPRFNFVKNKYQIIHNYDKPIEEIKAGDVVEMPDYEELFVVITKSKEGRVLLYRIDTQDYTRWFWCTEVKYPKLKTELEEAIEWFEENKKYSSEIPKKHIETILKELKK